MVDVILIVWKKISCLFVKDFFTWVLNSKRHDPRHFENILTLCPETPIFDPTSESLRGLVKIDFWALLAGFLIE